MYMILFIHSYNESKQVDFIEVGNRTMVNRGWQQQQCMHDSKRLIIGSKLQNKTFWYAMHSRVTIADNNIMYMLEN